MEKHTCALLLTWLEHYSLSDKSEFQMSTTADSFLSSFIYKLTLFSCMLIFGMPGLLQIIYSKVEVSGNHERLLYHAKLNH